MIDIDYFKLVNDSYGHDAGDVVLRVLAARCRKVLRESDLICRYGGEEFAILLAESEMPGAGCSQPPFPQHYRLSHGNGIRAGGRHHQCWHGGVR